MANANKGLFTGRVARKEMRKSNTTTVVNLSLAVNYYDRKTEQEQTMYINASAFGKMAEHIEKLADVGDLIRLEGAWRPNIWVRESTGEKHNELRLSVTEWEPLRKKGDRTGSSSANASSSSATPHDAGAATNASSGFYPMDETLEDDDLPF